MPWTHAQAVTPGMYLPPRQQPWQNKLALFSEGIIIVTGNVDDDTDGPGGSTAVDPCWQPQTSLRWPDQSSVNSRTFRGMVMHHVVQLRGAKLGDFGLVCLGGVLHCVQYYDEGPTEKLQEGSERTLRDTGVIDANQTSRHAATIGNDVQDFCALIFPGSAPRDQHGRPHAVEQDEMIARTLALWRKFTGRLAAAPDAGNSGTPALQPKSGAASGSVGLAAPLCLAAATLAPVLAESLLNQQGVDWLIGAVAVAGVVKLVTGIMSDAKKLKEKPSEYPALPSPVVVRHADQFVSKEEMQKVEIDLRNQMTELRGYVHDAVHEIKGVANSLRLAVQEQGEATQVYFDKLDTKNEERVRRIGDRVNEVIDKTPEKIIALLKNTGAIKG